MLASSLALPAGRHIAFLMTNRSQSVVINFSLNRLISQDWAIGSHIWPLYLPQKLIKSEILKVKLESVLTLLRITRLAYKKYLVIIYPNSHEKFTKLEIRSSWN